MPAEKLAIVVPCFNEYERMSVDTFQTFLSAHSGIFLLFVNDGSTDRTLSLLQQIHDAFPQNSSIISFAENRGKATAVREGILTALKNNSFDYVGFLDSDLSTGFNDFLRIYHSMMECKASYAFGARIKLMNTLIVRKAWRHMTGRILATLIDFKFRMGIYDTQCGAKIFERSIAAYSFSEPFHSTWLFDVEIFLRIRKKFPDAAGIEVPLNAWGEKKGSKLNALSAGTVTNDMFKLYWHYK